MGRFYLMNSAQQIVETLTVASMAEARQRLRERCMLDRAAYTLLKPLTRGVLDITPQVVQITEEQLDA